MRQKKNLPGTISASSKADYNRFTELLTKELAPFLIGFFSLSIPP